MKKHLPRLLPLLTLCTLLFMILHPADTLDAAFQGFQLWSSVVLPALFPFLTAANLLFSSGAAEQSVNSGI